MTHPPTSTPVAVATAILAAAVLAIPILIPVVRNAKPGRLRASRAAAKTWTWFAVSGVLLMSATFYDTGGLALSPLVVVWLCVAKTATYYLHERLWEVHDKEAQRFRDLLREAANHRHPEDFRALLRATAEVPARQVLWV